MVGALLAGVTAVCLAAGAGSVGAGPSQAAAQKYSKHERQLLAIARANGDKEVTLLIAAQKGARPNLLISSLAPGTTRRPLDEPLRERPTSALRAAGRTKEAPRG